VLTFLAVVFAAGLMGMALMRRHRRDRPARRPRTRPLTPDDDDLPMAGQPAAVPNTRGSVRVVS